MDNQPKQINLSEQKTDRQAIIYLSFGFLFLCFGSIPALEGSFLAGIPLAALGFAAIIYGSIKIKLAKMGQFALGIFGWSFVSLFINMFVLNCFNNPLASEIGVIASMAVFQLLGYGLAFLTFRKNKQWIGIGIIFASVPYLIGFAARSGSNPIIGLPFPFSLIPFGGQ
jgi:hypothetical protein